MVSVNKTKRVCIGKVIHPFLQNYHDGAKEKSHVTWSGGHEGGVKVMMFYGRGKS